MSPIRANEAVCSIRTISRNVDNTTLNLYFLDNDVYDKPVMENIHLRTPARADSPHPCARQLYPESCSSTSHYFSPALFDISTPFYTTPFKDPFNANDGLTAIRHGRVASMEEYLALQRAQRTLPTLPTLPDPHGDAETIFDSPLYNIDAPSTWPILHLPYHTSDGFSSPTHISEMTCHVHYKGFGAMTLHALLTQETEAAKTKEEKVVIELSAYLSWPFNCTRDGWRVYSGMSEDEVEQWKEAMGEWIGEKEGEVKQKTALEMELEAQEGKNGDAREDGKEDVNLSTRGR
jgi:hypothetical protein